MHWVRIPPSEKIKEIFSHSLWMPELVEWILGSYYEYMHSIIDESCQETNIDIYRIMCFYFYIQYLCPFLMSMKLVAVFTMSSKKIKIKSVLGMNTFQAKLDAFFSDL